MVFNRPPTPTPVTQQSSVFSGSQFSMISCDSDDFESPMLSPKPRKRRTRKRARARTNSPKITKHSRVDQPLATTDLGLLSSQASLISFDGSQLSPGENKTRGHLIGKINNLRADIAETAQKLNAFVKTLL